MITASTANEVLRKVDKHFNIHSAYAGNNLCVRSCGYAKPVSRAALSWGKTNEATARRRHRQKTRSMHKHFSCTESGLYIYETFPVLGASPDGITNCGCHDGFGSFECKCPWSARYK